MTGSDSDAPTATMPVGPVLFAYDGSELATLAIEQAGRQLAPGRDALVVCVWQPGDVGFLPTAGTRFNAAEATQVRKAAEETAAHGASLAERAGFRAQSIAIEAAPTWTGLLEVLEQCNASLIVLGAHRRSGLVGHLLGSVTAAVLAHSDAPALIVHSRQEASPALTPPGP
jgi:nucleotide-binding universal stress UspA family protein